MRLPDPSSDSGESRSLLEGIIAQSPFGIEWVGQDGTIFLSNAAAATLFGFADARTVIGESWFERWHPEDRAIAAAALQKARNERVEIVLRQPDPAEGTRLFEVSLAWHSGSPDEPPRFLVFTRRTSLDGDMADIVARSSAVARKLRDSEARFAALVDTMPQMVWSTLPDGFHDFYNARWYEFTGMPPGSTDGEAWNGMFHPDDQEKAWARWRHSLETGEPYEIEYRLRHHSGEYRWTLGRALPVRDEAGRIVRWFGTCTDIHEAKSNADMLELLSQELSHRIKNIFAIVQGLIGITARETPEFRTVALTLRDRIAALGRAHDYARPHSDESRPFVGETTLHALLREILKPYPALKEGRISIGGQDVSIDDKAATPLAMIFHELATNAMKYGGLSVPHGLVDITCERQDDQCVIVWQERNAPIRERSDKTGFGTRLANVAVEHHLGGRLERQWGDQGLSVRMTCSLVALMRKSPENSGKNA